MCICARTTTTKIGRNADKQHKKQDPHPRWQKILRMMVHRFCCLCLYVYVRVCVYLRVSVRERINAWITDPRAQPLNSDLTQP